MSTPFNSAHNLSVNQALGILEQYASSVDNSTEVPSFEAINQVLDEDVVAQKNMPERDNSAMDGFVFLESDLEQGTCDFPIHGEIRPEDENPAVIKQGNCLRIMTGAPIPDAECKVIPVELVEEIGGKVQILQIPSRNPVRKKGEGYEKGKQILSRNTLIRPYEAGLLIESGNFNCFVKQPLKIAVQVTGSELDETNNTNGPVLEELISQWPGTIAGRPSLLKDDPDITFETLNELSRRYDIVVTTGGISMGRHDYILESMEKMGAEVLIRKVKQKPGKPFTLTKLDDTYFFHLPGNPVSAVFCAEMYLRRFLFYRLELDHPTLNAVSQTELSNHRDKTLFVHGQVRWSDQGQAEVRMEPKMRSHLLQLYSGNNVYVRIEPDTKLKPGDLAEVIPTTPLLMGLLT